MGKRINAMDRVGTTIGNLKILDFERRNGRTYFYVQCLLCNNYKWMRSNHVIDKTVVSCGCYNKANNYIPADDLKGKTFGRLHALAATDTRATNGSVIWKCICDCGNEAYVSGDLLKKKKNGVKSCGCLRTEIGSLNGKSAGKYVAENHCIDGTNVKNLTEKISRRNKSGIKGVCWDKTRQKWVAQIIFKGKTYHLGRYSDINEAANARKKAEDELFGSFLNAYYARIQEKKPKI